MPRVSVGPPTQIAPPDSIETVAKSPDTFRYQTAAGTVFVGGKPPGVLKLRLRGVLTEDQYKDPEIKEIARAVLSLRSIDGLPPIVRSPEHFEAVLARFGSDDEVDAFMAAWQQFVNPEVFSAVQRAVEEGSEKGLIGERLNTFVQERLQEFAAQERENVKNS